MKTMKLSIFVLSFYVLFQFGCSENKKIIITTPDTSWWFGELKEIGGSTNIGRR